MEKQPLGMGSLFVILLGGLVLLADIAFAVSMAEDIFR
jgi:hypothetical protein